MTQVLRSLPDKTIARTLPVTLNTAHDHIKPPAELAGRGAGYNVGDAPLERGYSAVLQAARSASRNNGDGGTAPPRTVGSSGPPGTASSRTPVTTRSGPRHARRPSLPPNSAPHSAIGPTTRGGLAVAQLRGARYRGSARAAPGTASRSC